jgi:hypothetical protein
MPSGIYGQFRGKMSLCHPERPNWAKGKCVACAKQNNKVCTQCKINPSYRTSSLCKDCQIARNRVLYKNLRNELIKNLGGKCECCGESNYKFLTFDHKNNDGGFQRKQLNRRGIGISYFVELRKHLDGIQLMCWNCNCGRAYNNGICPHKEVA